MNHKYICDVSPVMYIFISFYNLPGPPVSCHVYIYQKTKNLLQLFIYVVSYIIKIMSNLPSIVGDDDKLPSWHECVHDRSKSCS